MPAQQRRRTPVRRAAGPPCRGTRPRASRHTGPAGSSRAACARSRRGGGWVDAQRCRSSAGTYRGRRLDEGQNPARSPPPVACLLLTGVACLGIFRTSTPTATADTKVVFNVALLQKPDSLNPYTGISAESYELWYLMYPTLTTPAQTDLSSTPALAASWSHSADALTWTFHLVKDAVVDRRCPRDVGRRGLQPAVGHRRRDAGGHLGQLPQRGHQGHRHGQAHRGAPPQEAQRRPALPADADRARAHLGEARQERGAVVQELAAASSVPGRSRSSPQTRRCRPSRSSATRRTSATRRRSTRSCSPSTRRRTRPCRP